MSAPASTAVPGRKPVGWRTPLIIVIAGCGVGLLAFGPRSALGFFLTPMSQENGWGRDVFGLALAIQNLLWGIGQPFAGALADRFGTIRVMAIGALLYAGGLALMAYSSTPLALDLTAGVMIGFGLAGSSFNLVIAAFGKLLPVEWRSLSFGAGTAAGSFGQFLFSPLAVGLNQAVGWQTTLIIFGAAMLMILPLSLALATPAAATQPVTAGAAEPQSLRQALVEALGHRSYVLLVLGFFTCGFQLAFITVHMPAYLVDRGLSAAVGGWTLAIIGLFNIVGSLASGWLGNRWPKRYLLAANYFSRAVAIAIFISLPASPAATLVFGAVMGLLWLSTVPPTSGLVLLMFGTRWFAMLSGFVFFSHQVGGFLGVLIGGIAFERTGSYDLVWWLAILFGVLSAVINLPIVEKPVARLAAARA
ncbi:MFS transporter [Rhodoplanes elegans]|uniref:MFS transporter n=1 Tax=Rhodoplanes elegans TaxID=29408 RepID=A0A327K8Q8_9BRAD|nr:MFS transporter [Rhodoplanes elegans]MBK5959757.1 MFS transporter [Rhodoplanes elegans]RAI34326.1 MFS transporter [Rhodoplanes elegans]